MNHGGDWVAEDLLDYANVSAFPADVCAAGHSKSVVIPTVYEPAGWRSSAQVRCFDAVAAQLFLAVGRLRAG